VRGELVTKHVAEFFNTATSVACVLPPQYWWSLPTPVDAGAIPLMYPLMSFIMVGSAAFHGTMTWEGQLLDELPILLLVGFNFSALLDTYSLLPRAAAAAPGGGGRVQRADWAPGPRLLAAAVALEVALLAYLYTAGRRTLCNLLPPPPPRLIG
jgi:hypothetical protein